MQPILGREYLAPTSFHTSFHTSFVRRFDVVSSPTTAGNLLLPACCLPAAACLLLLPPAAVLLPPERGKGVSREGEQLQGRKASGHMLVGMKDVTPIKTGGMAVRTV